MFEKYTIILYKNLVKPKQKLLKFIRKYQYMAKITR